MEESELTFGMLAVLAVYSCIRYCGNFEAISKFLQMTLWPLSCRNDKRNSIDKTQSIIGKYRGRHDVFIENVKTSQYVWGITPIEDTYVMYSIEYVGRELIFTIDTELLQKTTLNPDNNQALFNYSSSSSSSGPASVTL